MCEREVPSRARLTFALHMRVELEVALLQMLRPLLIRVLNALEQLGLRQVCTHARAARTPTRRQRQINGTRGMPVG